MRSYLNIIDITSSREIRAAEFGFYAEKPSFCLLYDNECILFERGNIKYIFSLADGSISSSRRKPRFSSLRPTMSKYTCKFCPMPEIPYIPR